jgi:hypothetical protein
VQLFADETTTIGVFMRNLGAFFRDARALEETAADKLAEAKRFTTPKTAIADERIQVFIKDNSALRKRIEDHWSITTAVHAFHRKLTAARARGVQSVEEASTVAQRLHNSYVLEARRIAAEQEDKIRRAEEARQQAIRDRELAEMERQALAAEAAAAGLSEREENFVDRLVRTPVDVRPTEGPRAAALAGFKDSIAQAARLLGLEKIQRALQAKDEALAIREQALVTKSAPLDVQVERVAPAISRAAGASDRVTKSARLLDDGLRLRNAVISGNFGIPHDVLCVDEAKLNTYARSLGKRINEWPGVQYVETTRTV